MLGTTIHTLEHTNKRSQTILFGLLWMIILVRCYAFCLHSFSRWCRQILRTTLSLLLLPFGRCVPHDHDEDNDDDDDDDDDGSVVIVTTT